MEEPSGSDYLLEKCTENKKSTRLGFKGLILRVKL